LILDSNTDRIKDQRSTTREFTQQLRAMLSFDRDEDEDEYQDQDEDEDQDQDQDERFGFIVFVHDCIQGCRIADSTLSRIEGSLTRRESIKCLDCGEAAAK